ncbi:hypothetical protein [Nocardia brasiliensis]|uniref:hypothetical protein n=1 Tax=Nocardia brasiliensis TaxID=37326 RepID=UPI002455BF20|nr:hypothetical protein [Nocardia brasiliensis]
MDSMRASGMVVGMRNVWRSFAASAAALVVVGVVAGNANAEGMFIGEYQTHEECVREGDKWQAWYGSSDTRPDCVYGQQGSGWQLWIRSI